MDLKDFFEDGMKEKYKKLLSNTAKPLLDKDAKLLDITPFVAANNAYRKRIKAEEDAYTKAKNYRPPEDFIDAEIEPAIEYVEEDAPQAPKRRRKRALSNFFENVGDWLRGAFRWLGEAFCKIGHWLAVAFRWLGPAILWLLKWCGVWLLRISLFAIVPLGMIIFTIILFVNPTLIYCYLHWGWIVCVFVALLIGVLTVTFFIRFNDFSYKALRLTILVVGTVVGFGMMIGAMASYSPELIEISSVSEMNLIKNVPGARSRNFVLTQDIDFNGGSFEETDFRDIFNNYAGGYKGTFDGNGHSIKNVKSLSLYHCLEGGTIQNIVFDNVEGIRIVDYNDGTISNITIQNSSFSIQPAGCEGIVIQKNEGTLSDITLQNLKFDVKDLSFFSLVCNINSETIKNVNIDGITISGNKVRDFAGIAEANYGTIENAHLSNFHVNAEVQTAHFIVLRSHGTEKNCSTQNCYINDIQSKYSGSISL